MVKNTRDARRRRLNKAVELEKEYRPEVAGVIETLEVEQYLRSLESIATLFSLGAEENIRSLWNIYQSSDEEALRRAVSLAQVWRIEAESLNLDVEEWENSEEPDELPIDDEWKVKIQHYIELIRGIVRDVEIIEPLRERILARLVELSSEVEKNRTSVQKYGEVWLEMTAAVGTGANNLKPAFELLRKITGGVVRARDQLDQPKLPSPDQVALPEVEGEHVGLSEEE